MSGLAPISEVSSDATRSEATSASHESRKEAMRKLRFGSRVAAKRTTRLPSAQGQTAPAAEPPAAKTETRSTTNAVESPITRIAQPIFAGKTPKQISVDKPGSQTSYNGDDEGPDASMSSLNLDSFPLPPLHGRLTVCPEHDASGESEGRSQYPTQQIEHPLSTGQSQSHGQHTPGPSPQRPDRILRTSSSPNRYFSPALHALADGAASITSGRPVSTVDSALVDMIARSVAEHLRRLSVSIRRGAGSPITTHSGNGSKKSISDESRTSSQKEALERFAKELHKYAEQTNAKGKRPRLTPSSRSPATLHTISALMPYRREFKSAGLAVTSKDQTQQRTTKESRSATRGSRRNVIKPGRTLVRMSQTDGKDELVPTTPSNSEVSFVSPGNADEWRYALIDPIPSATQVSTKRLVKNAKGLCFPCFPTLLNKRESVQENIKRSSAIKSNIAPAVVSHSSRLQGKPQRPSHIPLPRPRLESAEPSPRHLCDGVGSMGVLAAPQKTTGYRRPSMTVSRSHDYLESCYEGHSYTHPDTEIHKHNPRPTATHYLHPSAAVPPRTGTRQLQGAPPEIVSSQSFKVGPRMTTGVSLPEVPSMRKKPANSPPPLRHTVGHLPERTHSEKRELIVRNPTEPVIEAVNESANERLFPLQTSKGRSSASAKSKSKALGPRQVRPSIPMRASSIVQSVRAAECVTHPKVTDRDVLRGLHVATSAACDEEVDKYVSDKSGVRIRQFLADLVALETYWNEVRPYDYKEQRARQRKAQMRKLKQHMRRSRVPQRSSDQTR